MCFTLSKSERRHDLIFIKSHPKRFGNFPDSLRDMCPPPVRTVHADREILSVLLESKTNFHLRSAIPGQHGACRTWIIIEIQKKIRMERSEQDNEWDDICSIMVKPHAIDIL